MRYFFEIAYHGANYAGWQSQANAIGVQAVVEDVLSKIFRTSVRIIGSGRTDTGVHCQQQFFHADLAEEIDTTRFVGKLNSFLPHDIAIRSVCRVKDDAHARYSATERSYQYRLTKQKNPFLEGLALHYFKPLNIQTMNEAAALLVGIQDFTSFSKVKTDVNNFICDIKKAAWQEESELVIFNITANRFLRGMVRAIAGTLLDVGSGKISVSDFQNIINARNRRDAGANIAPYGLFLTAVKYPDSVFMEK